MYENGCGVDQDYEKAFKYFKLASKQDLAIAQCKLGSFYKKGLFVELDIEKSLHFYRLAADNDSEIAKMKLIKIYNTIDQKY